MSDHPSPADKEKEEVRALIEKAVEALGTDEFLDELVHDAKSQEASSINNSGIDEQIQYLLEALGAHDLKTLIRQNMEGSD